MRVIIRADASTDIGTGHVMRCLTLADHLRQVRADVSFLSRRLPGNLFEVVELRGFKVIAMESRPTGQTLEVSESRRDAEESRRHIRNLPGPVDWLIVDHYGLGSQWELEFRPMAKRIGVIDDLANRAHACDLLLDQNLRLGDAAPYSELVPSRCITLLGPRYALLRHEFHDISQRIRTGALEHLLIFLGGSDLPNVTAAALRAALAFADSRLKVDVVLGSSNPHRGTLSSLCQGNEHFRLSVQTSEMAALMNSADLAIGAAGTASWERCFLGLPAILVVLAQNQAQNARALHESGAAINLGVAEAVQPEKILEVLTSLAKDPARLLAMGQRAKDVMGGSAFVGANGMVEAMQKTAVVHV